VARIAMADVARRSVVVRRLFVLSGCGTRDRADAEGENDPQTLHGALQSFIRVSSIRARGAAWAGRVGSMRPPARPFKRVPGALRVGNFELSSTYK